MDWHDLNWLKNGSMHSNGMTTIVVGVFPAGQFLILQIMLETPRIVVLIAPPFQQNSLVVGHPADDRCVVVDPGFNPRQIINAINDRHWTPEAILLTHGHVDHIAGVAALKQAWPNLPVCIGAGDAPLLTNSRLNLSAPFGVDVVSPPADRLLADGERVAFAGLDFLVREIPGHSPGHVVFILEECRPMMVIGGDVLFQGSIGRTDFPGGSQALLVAGIRGKLFTLPDDTVVYPGHGECTTIGEERLTNPYCGD